VDPKLAHDGMTAPIDIVKMESRMNGCKKAAVKPSPRLTYQFWYLSVDISCENAFRSMLLLARIYLYSGPESHDRSFWMPM
jgi:hypothetical protein